MAKTMKATILSDNIPWGELECEWGFSAYIEYGEQKILLDCGASGLFLKNAEKLGISPTEADYGVLSHGHYDHSNGLDSFFAQSADSKFYIRPECGSCYQIDEGELSYAGMPKEVIERYSDRLVCVEGDYSPSEGVWLIPHKLPGMAAMGEADEMYMMRDGKLVPDELLHEQSLVLDTDRGLVIFNSCSHGGADNIINEVAATFPERPICAIIGGFHLYNKTEEQIRAFAGRVRDTGISYVYTGHCTGEQAAAWLKEELGDRLYTFHAGLVIEI